MAIIRPEWRIELPYYSREYLEELCERTVSEFCIENFGQELAPLPTDVLTQLLEQHTSVLNLYAQLDDGINGVTTMFASGQPPRVDIAARTQPAVVSPEPPANHPLRTSSAIYYCTRHSGALNAWGRKVKR